MISFNELKLMNYTQIKCLQQIKKDTTRNELIKQMLKDETCFFKLKKEDAYIVLSDIGIEKTQLEKVYNNLTSKSVFEKLVKENKIDINNNLLRIKYDIKNENKISFNVNESVKNNQQIQIVKQSYINKILQNLKKFFKIKK